MRNTICDIVSSEPGIRRLFTKSQWHRPDIIFSFLYLFVPTAEGGPPTTGAAMKQ